MRVSFIGLPHVAHGSSVVWKWVQLGGGRAIFMVASFDLGSLVQSSRSTPPAQFKTLKAEFELSKPRPGQSCVDITLLDDIAALRSVNLAEAIVIDNKRVPSCASIARVGAASYFPASQRILNRLGTMLQHLFSVRVTKVAGFLRPTSP
ncbi:hypothetical protein [Bradyrhizobium sp. JYMT SZCCT0180]|uniref:hypothetical protein n=1 Tax=Bradyrhizobium sp. JYMT SZCCT0180 TaxID=2807666 RepID=UPI001BA630E7|nr:hypothetical protein [Bradyrhizobium sp. JYMT SZCCT0180]MBR1216001.1 hypothetical protein [Bradyrhizobium sp. JYMT SZCCT0180]